MKRLLLLAIIVAGSVAYPALSESMDPDRDILVTFENDGARATTVGVPYRARKRYTISAEARRHSSAVAREYGLREVDHWPIGSLSVYCFVYRVAEGEDRSDVLNRLRNDDRVESAQELNVFETGTSTLARYDDTYANLQHGLSALNLTRAHQYSRGKGVRVAVIDSNVDAQHEDLKGRIRNVIDFAPSEAVPDHFHGTAVTSIIAASANNAKGIVGVAPEAQLDLYVACWTGPDTDTAICDSFALAKAIDALLEKPPNVLNMSLAGPPDPLLERLLQVAHRHGTILVAASPDGKLQAFPASMDSVIAVQSGTAAGFAGGPILAPGKQIIVAVPDNAYDFRSGSSLAAAHVTGVVALMLAISPGTGPSSVLSILQRSQVHRENNNTSVDACMALRLADPLLGCET